MPSWVESNSASFRARHSSAESRRVVELLESLERLRRDLCHLFPRIVGDMTIVIHDSPASLSAATPSLAPRRAATDPAMRRYVGGWAGRDEIHVLSPRILETRAAKVTGSREMLSLTTEALYARRVIVENNHELVNARSVRRLVVDLRWGWLLEGSSRWFAGQTDHARPAIARRLRDGRRPSFPPHARDAALLGGTIVDMLARERGPQAAATFATRLHPQGSRAAISKAFGRGFGSVEGDWHAHLARLADAAERR
jgi:hypothetical protein